MASCVLFNKPGLFKADEVITENFYKSIKIEVRMGLMIVPVSIKGKQYNFLFDSGALTVLDEKVYKELGLKPIGKGNITDSKGIRKKLAYTRIDEILIADIPFTKIDAVVADLHYSDVLNCIKLDGIIGGNLMRNCKWLVDFQNKSIEFSNDEKKLGMDKSAVAIPFVEHNNGTPKIDLTVNDYLIKNVTFDLGSAGSLSIPKNKLKDIFGGNKFDSLVSIGYGSSGLYGSSIDTTILFESTVALDPTIESKQVVKASSSNKKLLGMKFLKNFKILMNWETKTISMERTSEGKFEDDLMMDWSPYYADSSILIGSVIKNSMSWMQGVRPLDTLEFIDTTYYQNISREGYCKMINNYRELPPMYVIKIKGKVEFVSDQLLFNELKVD